MVTVAIIHIPLETVALEEALTECPEMQFRLERTAGAPAGDATCLWVAGPSRGAVETALENDTSVKRLRYVTGNDDTWLYGVEFVNGMSMFRRAIFTDGGVVLDGSGRKSGWTFRLRFSTREDLSGAMELLAQYGFEPTVNRLHEIDTEKHAGEVLTEKQYRALRLALEEGYFEIPRRMNLEGLADELGYTHQSLSELLRRGEKRLVADFFDRNGQLPVDDEYVTTESDRRLPSR